MYNRKSEKAMTKQDFLNMGGELWKAHSLERVYVSKEMLEGITDQLPYAWHGEKFYFDCSSHKLMYNNNSLLRPKVLIEFNPYSEGCDTEEHF